MKIIQTFWAAPAETAEARIEFGGRLSGGWISERYHAISWTLSCLKFREFYPEIELYTDGKGSSWLIDKLDLPYSNVHVDLDVLNEYDPMLWAIPKLYVYSKQRSPFMHADGDVFIWKKLDTAIEQSDLFVQNFETNHFYYKIIVEQIEDHFSYIPDCLRNLRNQDSGIQSINAGVIGGSNIDFFQQYTNLAFEFIKRNERHLQDVDLGMFNTVFEQLLFLKLAQSDQLHISTFFDDSDDTFEQFLSINTVPLLNQYVHTLGASKQNPLINMELEARLKYEFPKHHRHIDELYREQKIYQLSFLSKERFPLKLGSKWENTITLVERLMPDYDLSKFQIGSLIDQLTHEGRSLTEPEQLIVDVFQIENVDSQLNNCCWPAHECACDSLINDIHGDLSVLYTAKDKQRILNQEFTLRENFKIVHIRHSFELELTTDYLKSVVEGKTEVPECDGNLLLVENRYGEKVYSLLSEWDQLLYYFEDMVLTGSQLGALIESGETPFTTNGDDLETDVFNFLISQCFLLRRLRTCHS